MWGYPKIYSGIIPSNLQLSFETKSTLWKNVEALKLKNLQNI